jgi:hypothetical protein
MNKAIARIGRDNHLKHLIAMLPFITLVFGIQCFLMFEFHTDEKVGDYALILAAGLVSFISALAYYDNHHHVIIYPKYIHIFFPLLGTDRTIYYHDIDKIIAPEKECTFSSLIIKLKNEDQLIFYFVDYPVHVKKLIESQYIEEAEGENIGPENKNDQAA